MSDKKKISLDDIFDDDDFGLLDSKAKVSNIKSEIPATELRGYH